VRLVKKKNAKIEIFLINPSIVPKKKPKKPIKIPFMKNNVVILLIIPLNISVLFRNLGSLEPKCSDVLKFPQYMPPKLPTLLKKGWRTIKTHGTNDRTGFKVTINKPANNSNGIKINAKELWRKFSEKEVFLTNIEPNPL